MSCSNCAKQVGTVLTGEAGLASPGGAALSLEKLTTAASDAVVALEEAKARHVGSGHLRDLATAAAEEQIRLAQAERAADVENQDVAITLVSAASCWVDAGDHGSALRVYGQAWELAAPKLRDWIENEELSLTGGRRIDRSMAHRVRMALHTIAEGEVVRSEEMAAYLGNRGLAAKQQPGGEFALTDRGRKLHNDRWWWRRLPSGPRRKAFIVRAHRLGVIDDWQLNDILASHDTPVPQAEALTIYEELGFEPFAGWPLRSVRDRGAVDDEL